MEKEPITSQGLEKIKKELQELKNVKRPKIIEAIAEARGHGDLKENAEYHAAKEEQAKIESRIIEINDLIARANVVDVTKIEKKDKVIFGKGKFIFTKDKKFQNLTSSEKIMKYTEKLNLPIKNTNFFLNKIDIDKIEENADDVPKLPENNN